MRENENNFSKRKFEKHVLKLFYRKKHVLKLFCPFIIGSVNY